MALESRSVGDAGELRHRDVPLRRFGRKLILARPADGGPVVLEAPGVAVWRRLDRWTTIADLAGGLAWEFPEVPDADRWRVLTETLQGLEDDGFLERR